jgi:hypothetical protein
MGGEQTDAIAAGPDTCSAAAEDWRGSRGNAQAGVRRHSRWKRRRGRRRASQRTELRMGREDPDAIAPGTRAKPIASEYPRSTGSHGEAGVRGDVRRDRGRCGSTPGHGTGLGMSRQRADAGAIAQTQAQAAEDVHSWGPSPAAGPAGTRRAASPRPGHAARSPGAARPTGTTALSHAASAPARPHAASSAARPGNTSTAAAPAFAARHAEATRATGRDGSTRPTRTRRTGVRCQGRSPRQERRPFGVATTRQRDHQGEQTDTMPSAGHGLNPTPAWTWTTAARPSEPPRKLGSAMTGTLRLTWSPNRTLAATSGASTKPLAVRWPSSAQE